MPITRRLWDWISPYPIKRIEFIDCLTEIFKRETMIMNVIERIEAAIAGIKGDIARAYGENADLRKKLEDLANINAAQASKLSDLQSQLDKVAGDLEAADAENAPDAGGSMGGVTA